MGLFTRIADAFKTTEKVAKGYNFSDEERERALKVKAWKQEMAEKKAELEQTTQELKAKKEQMKLDLEIKKLEQELAEYDEEDDEIELPESANPEDTMMVTLLSKVLNHNQTPAPISQPVTSARSNDTIPTGAGVSLTDEAIDGYVKTIPKFALKQVRKLNDDELRTQILNINKDLDNNSIQRVIAKIRT